MNRIDSSRCLVSACLTGMQTRYDGKSKASAPCLSCLQDKQWIPVCPEQLGGLPTPRPAANIIGGNGHDVLVGTARVVNILGQDVTTPFIKGARMVLEIAQAQDIRLCYLKGRSPSCGVHEPGVLAALLLENGITVEEF